MITRGETMLALRRQRMAAAIPFLRGGFRPFFFGGTAWGLIALTLWLLALSGTLALPTHFDPVAWHRHEMLFGFVGAVVAGFLLTAIPNWTGRLPIAGKPLASLFGLWAAARLGVVFSSLIGAGAAAVLDVGFFVVLAGVAGREVLASKNRNLPVVGIVLLLGIACALDHAAASGLLGNGEVGWQAATAVIVVLMSLIGGRITPSFTRNWMAKQGISGRLPEQPGRFDMLAIAATAVALIAWVGGLGGALGAGSLALAAGLQGARLARWSGWRTAREPLVLILHVGYAWIPAGLMLLALSQFGAPVPQSAAVHAITAGAMATMILAVMTRATLGHTGRTLTANAPTVVIYGLVTAGAVLRVTAPLGYPDYTFGMRASAFLWSAALLLFLLAYGPILWRPRAGEGAN